jgi:hypothetical protein
MSFVEPIACLPGSEAPGPRGTAGPPRPMTPVRRNRQVTGPPNSARPDPGAVPDPAAEQCRSSPPNSSLRGRPDRRGHPERRDRRRCWPSRHTRFRERGLPAGRTPRRRPPNSLCRTQYCCGCNGRVADHALITTLAILPVLASVALHAVPGSSDPTGHQCTSSCGHDRTPQGRLTSRSATSPGGRPMRTGCGRSGRSRMALPILAAGFLSYKSATRPVPLLARTASRAGGSSRHRWPAGA